MIIVTIMSVTLSASFAAEPAVIFRGAARNGERTWRKVQRSEAPEANLSAREVFSYALALSEAKIHPARLEKLFSVVSQMQDCDKASRGYGNFKWYWRDEAVKDFNSVEFCMQGGSILWIRHRDAMPPATRKILKPMLELAVEGCLRHAVPTSYTNIALMNAENLILLGEALDRPKVADEGYRRLKEFLLYTWECGIHEYVSPTYYGVDLECLLQIHRFAKRDEGRAWAAALLELIWTDIAANWYAPAARLGGARSRDYNYLCGTGYLDRPLQAFGYLKDTGRYDINWVFFAQPSYRPPQRLHTMATTQFPRLVRQRWGESAAQFRTQYLCKDVTLSCAGANYGAMDLPLTADFPGPRDSLRCYYIPDGRHDPYGKVKIPAGAHNKTLHLKSFWAGTQHRGDALGIVLHERPGGAAAPPAGASSPPATLETHFVMPLDVDAFFVGDKRIAFDPSRTHSVPVAPDQPVIIRNGSAAVGIRVPWSLALDGRTAPVNLVWDGNPHRAVRLTITHHTPTPPVTPKKPAPDHLKTLPRPGAALWVRIGSGLTDDASHAKWRKAFATAKATATSEPARLAVTVAGPDKPVSLVVAPLYNGVISADPPFGRCILEIDGKDVGRDILKDLTPIKTQVKAIEAFTPVTVLADKGVYFEAESAVVAPGMTVAPDPAASGGRYVWAPGEAGGRGRVSGSATWRLRIPKPGRYVLWARVLAPTSTDDSFYVRLFNNRFTPLDRTDWHTGRHEKWRWTPIALAGSKTPTPLPLPAGMLTLEIRPREDGTKLDRLFITPLADDRPK